MFSNVPCTTFLALFASAVAVSATRSLSIKATGEPTVSGIDKLIVTTTVTNTGDEILTLLNHPESPLNKLPANTFAITDAAGIPATFTGIKAKYVPANAIAIGKDAVTVLAPGQSIEVEHDLSEAYAFDKEGEYNIVPNNRLYFVNAKKEAIPIYATIEAHTVRLTGRLAVRHLTQIKRATYSGCSSSEQSSLVSAAAYAQIYASNATSYLLTYTYSTPRYETWFGTYDSSRHSIVTAIFNNINSTLFSSYTYDCTCTLAGTYAYVYPSQFGKIYLCGAFWNAPLTGTDSKAGTLIHESSHFTVNGGTQDYVYGQSNAKTLALNDPDEAVYNADNYEYFAENNPALS